MKTRIFKIGCLVVIGLFLFIIGIGIGGAGKSGPSPAPTVTITAPAHAAQAAHAAPSPSPRPRPTSARVLYTLSGNGIKNSPAFTVSGTVTVSYSYSNCDGGGSGNFIADLETSDQSSFNSDDQSIANALGSSGHDTTTVYPSDPGKPYHLAINSECDFTITVKSG
jgi:hypothetical protein